GRQFEADLVIALAGCAVSDGVSARFPGDFDQSVGDQRPRNGSAKQVESLILRIGAKHREYEIADKFFAYILDVDFLDAEHLRLPARRLEVAVALAEVGGEGDDFSAQFGLQPLQDDGGVEAARIGEYDLLYVFQLGHLYRFRDQVSRARYHAPSRFGKRRADRVVRRGRNVPTEYFILLEKALRSVPRHASGGHVFHSGLDDSHPVHGGLGRTRHHPWARYDAFRFTHAEPGPCRRLSFHARRPVRHVHPHYFRGDRRFGADRCLALCLHGSQDRRSRLSDLSGLSGSDERLGLLAREEDGPEHVAETGLADGAWRQPAQSEGHPLLHDLPAPIRVCPR